MLKAVVEHVDRRAEAPLGKHAGKIAILGDGNHRPGHCAREHQRLVAGRVDIREHACAVGHDDDAIDAMRGGRSRG